MPEEMQKMTQRSEASNDISEFNLNEVGKEKVKLKDLLKTLKKGKVHETIKQQLKNASKEKTLDVPLSKPQTERIQRTVAYEKVSNEVKKWDNVVQIHRMADQIIYPLKQPELRLEVAEDYTKRFQSKNALEEEVSKLLNKSENVLDQEKVITIAEEKALKAMSLAEAKARYAELRKIRALLSFQEAKAKRQKKIKSKKYHRLLKKEKMKKLMKEFEELQKTDPESAKEKLQEADKLRILERMTLKHKNTGKWAQQQKLRAKYNPDSRVALKEQMNLAKLLTDKAIVTDDFNEVIENDDAEVEDDSQAHDVEDGDLLDLYKLSEDSIFKKPDVPKVQIKKKKVEETIKTVVQEEEQDLVDETCERLQTTEDFDKISGIVETIPKSLDLFEEPKSTNKLEKPKKSQQKTTTTYVSETDFTSETNILDSMVPDDITLGDEEIDDENEDQMNIKQAFADEDFISEFREDKKTAIKKDQPEGISLYLPGWGSWGGAGIKPSRRKRRRFYIKPPDIPARKDSTLGNVIINEDKDKKAATHQITQIPFQYQNIHQFESIIRQPVGNTWNPEISFQKMIAPQVVTKLGKIIDPMDADDLPPQEESETKKMFKRKSQQAKQHKGRTKSKRKMKIS